MLYIIGGLLLGIILNFFPLLQPQGGSELYPEWTGRLDNIAGIHKSPISGLSQINLGPVIAGNSITMLSGNADVRARRVFTDSLFSVSGSGSNFVTYEKAGKAIEYFNITGDRFWKVESREYPYLSHNGKLVLLLKSDHSAVRIFDYNGTPVGQKMLSGRFATVISFSDGSDAAAIGFLDGTFYLIDGSGNIVYTGKTPDGTVVKSIALSGNGLYAAIHCGDDKKDSIIIVKANNGSAGSIDTERVHHTKTAIHITDDGRVAFLDYNHILVADSSGKKTLYMKVPAAKTGTATIKEDGGLFFVSYTLKVGESQFIVFREDGSVIYHRRFPQESFLHTTIRNHLILLRGSGNLYCYRYHL